ncbi:hypothetical protein ONZ51_g10535 [Trametes cubensis]|uniref:Uncharacterized protein n=1 Tax=Trametes cubensis TaxID=1111947 RepID=A0AAD7X6A2_9APHY|nr:hypothetical protein ONZ51_g10535 [Trametes cubensis]
MGFCLCNSEESILTRVSGGMALRIITTMDESVYFDFPVGWSNPAVDSTEANVVKASRGVYGYESLGDIATHMVYIYVQHPVDEVYRTTNGR